MGENEFPGCDPLSRRRWSVFYRLSELLFCPWPEGRMAWTRGTRQASASVPLPNPVSAQQLLKLSFFSIGNRPRTRLPSARFPNPAGSAPRVLCWGCNPRYPGVGYLLKLTVKTERENSRRIERYKDNSKEDIPARVDVHVSVRWAGICTARWAVGTSPKHRGEDGTRK